MISSLYSLLGFFIPLAEFDSGTISVPPEVAPENNFSYLRDHLLPSLFCASALSCIQSCALGGQESGWARRFPSTVGGNTLPRPEPSRSPGESGQTVVLVGAAERNLTFLAEIQDPDLLETIQAELVQPAAGRQGSGKGFADYLKGLLDGGQNHSEKAGEPEVLTQAQRIEERLMKYRTHRGHKSDG